MPLKNVDLEGIATFRSPQVGGGACLPGLDARLRDELAARDAGGDYRVLDCPFSRPDAAWIGASLVAAAAPPGGLPGLSSADIERDGLPDLFACGVCASPSVVFGGGA